MATVAELAVAITAQDLASGALRDIRGELDKTHQAALVAGAGLTALGTGMAITLASAGRAAADFQQQMSAVKAVLDPAEIARSGPALEQLALKLGRGGLGFSAGEAAQGLEALAKAGVSVEDQMSGAGSVLNLAAAGGIKVGEAAEFAANTMSVFNLKGTDMAHVADLMAGAANATTADVGDLRLAMQQFGAVANLTGQSVDATTTAIALMAQAGIKGSDAGTSLKTMFLNLQPSTAKQADEMRRLGLITADGTNTFLTAGGAFKQAGEIAAILNERLGGLTKAQRAASLEIIFGSDAIRASAVLTEAGAEGWAKLTGEIGKVTAAEVAKTRLDNLNGSLKNFENSVNATAIAVGTNLAPGLQPGIDKVTGLVNAFAELPPQAHQSVAAVAAIGAAATLTAGTILTATAGAALMGTTLTALALAAAPVALPIAAIAAASAALAVAWVNDWGGIQEKTAEAGAAVSTTLGNVGGDLGKVGNILGEGVADWQRYWANTVKPVAEVDVPETPPPPPATGGVDATGNLLGTSATQQAFIERAREQGQAIGEANVQGFIDGLSSAADEKHAARDEIFAQGLLESKALSVLATEQGKLIADAYIMAYGMALDGAKDSADIQRATTNIGVETAKQLMEAFPVTLASPELFDKVAAIIRGWALDTRRPATEVGEAIAEAVAEGFTAAAPTVEQRFDALQDSLGKKAGHLKEMLAAAGQDEELLRFILHWDSEIKAVGQALTLTDQAIAAHVVALENDGKLTEAAALATAHLAAQHDTKAKADAAASEATKAHTKELHEQEQALKKAEQAAKDAATALGSGYAANASAMLSALTAPLDAATRGHLELIKVTQGVEAAAREAFTAAGGSVAEFANRVAGKLDEARKAADRYAAGTNAALSSVTRSAGVLPMATPTPAEAGWVMPAGGFLPGPLTQNQWAGPAGGRRSMFDNTPLAPAAEGIRPIGTGSRGALHGALGGADYVAGLLGLEDVSTAEQQAAALGERMATANPHPPAPPPPTPPPPPATTQAGMDEAWRDLQRRGIRDSSTYAPVSPATLRSIGLRHFRDLYGSDAAIPAEAWNFINATTGTGGTGASRSDLVPLANLLARNAASGMMYGGNVAGPMNGIYGGAASSGGGGGSLPGVGAAGEFVPGQGWVPYSVASFQAGTGLAQRQFGVATKPFNIETKEFDAQGRALADEMVRGIAEASARGWAAGAANAAKLVAGQGPGEGVYAAYSAASATAVNSLTHRILGNTQAGYGGMQTGGFSGASTTEAALQWAQQQLATGNNTEYWQTVISNLSGGTPTTYNPTAGQPVVIQVNFPGQFVPLGGGELDQWLQNIGPQIARHVGLR